MDNKNACKSQHPISVVKNNLSSQTVHTSRPIFSILFSKYRVNKWRTSNIQNNEKLRFRNVVTFLIQSSRRDANLCIPSIKYKQTGNLALSLSINLYFHVYLISHFLWHFVARIIRGMSVKASMSRRRYLDIWNAFRCGFVGCTTREFTDLFTHIHIMSTDMWCVRKTTRVTQSRVRDCINCACVCMDVYAES